MRTKFARTMDEAFPHGAEYGCAIKVTRKKREWPWVVGTIALALIAGVLFAWRG